MYKTRKGVNMAKKANTKKAVVEEEILEEDELLEDEELEEDEDEIEEDEDDEEGLDDDEDEIEDEEDEDDEDLEDDDEDDDDEEEEEDEEEDEDDEDLEDDDDEEEDDDEDDEEDEEEDDDLDDDDEDDDDEDDEEDEDEDDEDDEPVAPKKSSKAASAKKSSKTTSKKTSKSSKASAKTPAKKEKSYDDYFSSVTDKVATYKDALGTAGVIPPSRAISMETLYNLIATYKDEDDVNALEAFAKKMAKKMGVDPDEVDEYNLKVATADAQKIYEHVITVIYNVLNAEAAINLYSNEDCNAQIRGEWTKKKTTDNSRLHTSKGRDITIVDPYLNIKVTGGAPKNKKHVGTMKGKKFVESTDAPAKKTSKKKETTKKTSAKKTTTKKTSKKK